MSQFTLHEWMQSDAIALSYSEEVLEEADRLMSALHEHCATHDIQMVCVMQTQADPSNHRLLGTQYLDHATKAPPELLVCSIMLTNGLVDGLPVMETLVQATGERYGRLAEAPKAPKTHLKLVKSDD